MSKKEHVDDLDDPKYDTEATLEMVSEEAVVELTEEPRKPEIGDPDYDWSQHYDTDDLYTHTFPDGKVVTIKSMAAIYSKTWLYKIRDVKTEAQIAILGIERAACPEANALLMSLDDTTGDPFDDLYKAWLQASTSHGEGDEGLTSGN